MSPTQAKDFKRLLENGALSELHQYGIVVISCGSCDVQWERERHDGREATCRDRMAARNHVVIFHSEAYRK